jgi:hypothetical protein
VKPYGADGLPAAALERLAEPGWLQEALKAIDRLPGCRFFTSPVPLGQFCGAKAGRRFTAKVLEQEFDDPRRLSPSSGPRGLDDRPPPQAWSGEDAARFEATKAALAAKFREEVA